MSLLLPVDLSTFTFIDWLNGSASVLIKEVALRRTRLVPGLVTALGRVNHLNAKLVILGPDFRKILGRSYENLRKFLRLMKILGKTYDNADFRKILRKT